MTANPFYINLLLFVARRTAAEDDRTRTLMQILEQAAAAFTATGRYTVPAGELDLTARAFAGVAGMLQKQILPETIAAGHKEVEQQVRTAIDTAMAAVNLLLSRAGLGIEQDVVLSLPDPQPASPAEA